MRCSASVAKARSMWRARIQEQELHTERTHRFVHVLPRGYAPLGGVRGVHKKTHGLGCRHQLVQQRQSFGNEFRGEDGHARDVPTGSREAPDDSACCFCVAPLRRKFDQGPSFCVALAVLVAGSSHLQAGPIINDAKSRHRLSCSPMPVPFSG